MKQTISLLLLFLVLVLAIYFVGSKSQATTYANNTQQCPSDLFFSEYIEGSANNKGIEIYNGTSQTVNLEGYQIELYTNGSTTVQSTLALSGNVVAGDVYVIINSSADAALQPLADITHSVANFNGDDFLLLKKNGVIIDSFGQLGVDPGTAWGTGEYTANEHTLVRKAMITAGDTNGSDSFDPSAEWDSYQQNSFQFLGSHTIECETGGTATPISITPTVTATMQPTTTNTPPPISAACGEAATLIHEIQGSADMSPVNNTIQLIEGIVSADFRTYSTNPLGGFYLQEESTDQDSDPATSEGIFVYAPTDTTSFAIGDRVRVQGMVAEYNNLTELKNIDFIQLCGSAEPVTATEVTLPLTSTADWERYEGMLVAFSQKLIVTELYTFGRYGEMSLALNSPLYNPTQITAPGVLANNLQTSNDLQRILIDDGSRAQNPATLPHLSAGQGIRIGDEVGRIEGVLDYAFGAYRLQPTQPITLHPTTTRPTEPETVGGALKISAFNVLNYFTTLDTGTPQCGPTGTLDCRGANTAEEFERQRTKIIAALATINADIFGLLELENNASASLEDLVAGLNAKVGTPAYDYIKTGTIGTDAIKIGIIYNTNKVTPVGNFAILDSSVDPKFIDTKNRPILAQTFVELASQNKLTVVTTHLKSKGSDCNAIGDPDAGDGQGNCNKTRTDAADALIRWLKTDPTQSDNTKFLVIGDFNAYGMEDPIVLMETNGYTDLAEKYEGEKRYSYVFAGQRGTLDYAFASSTLLPDIAGATTWHINSDEGVYLDYNDYNQATAYQPDPYRSSDHDPIILGIDLRATPTPIPTGEIPESTSTPTPVAAWRIFLPMLTR